MRVILGMYTNVQSGVRVNAQYTEYSEEFGVGVRVHQGPVLSPLLSMLTLAICQFAFDEY